MREFSTPLDIDIPATGNLTDDVVRNAHSIPHRVTFSRHIDGTWVDVTASEFHAQVERTAKGLIGAGLAPGDRVALLSKTRFEWTVLDYAIWFAGAITVPIYETSSASQIGHILRDAGVRAVVAESAAHVQRIAEISDATPALENVWSFDADAMGAIAALGAEITDATLESRRSSLTPASPATIIYTSGTTGAPKGCVLTHGNFMFELGVAVDILGDLFDSESASTLLFLPLAHVFARIVQIGAVKAGARLGHSADIKNLLPDLAEFKPTFILAVPRVFEKVFNSASQKAAAEGKGKIFNRATDVAIAWSRAEENGRAGLLLKAQHAVFSALVYSKVRTALGGNCQYAISGGAPLGERLGHYFRGLGVTVLEGYGLTETTAALAVNLPEALKIGTVGRPFPGTSVRVANDGELFWRGGQVFEEYWQNPEATAAAFDESGWFASGDVGEIDDEGFVKITGRKKEIIVTAGGKNVAPAVLEDRLRAHAIVDQCLVVGDGQPFIGALVTVDEEFFPAWKQAKGKSGTLSQLLDDPELLNDVQAAIDDANKAVSKAESIRKFHLLDAQWTEEGGQLTPSMKLKRNVVMREFRSEIDALYLP